LYIISEGVCRALAAFLKIFSEPKFLEASKSGIYEGILGIKKFNFTESGK
jgi:hypothetical protein